MAIMYSEIHAQAHTHIHIYIPTHAKLFILVHTQVLKVIRGVGDGSGGSRIGPGEEGSANRTNGYHGGEGRGGRRGPQKRGWGGSRRRPIPPHRRKRCLGAAVEYALRCVMDWVLEMGWGAWVGYVNACVHGAGGLL